ncbi:ProQ/FINO family protein (plasmid) [Skermanella rosea]|uniref:ProQ/FINO family protein n=1 Tax=Skermanella rosea TaxID=1817965 RepID=UPI001931B0A9|nr:ProQ/FINO family protein [Skermanella rosea]UEM08229.1 ProQ/FINO family protein [Skermanella rosea]
MPTEIRADRDLMRIVERIAQVVSPRPAVLPTAANPIVRPMVLGIISQLHERVVSPEGMRKGDAHSMLSQAVKHYARSALYKAALAAPGAWRHDLDGNPVEPVSQEHADLARTTPALSIRTKETITMQIPGLKIAQQIAADQLRPVDDIVKVVTLAIDLGDGRPFTVQFSGRNYRRALRQIDEARASGHKFGVLLQGRLVAGHRIEEAGLSVQMRARPAPDAETPA